MIKSKIILYLSLSLSDDARRSIVLRRPCAAPIVFLRVLGRLSARESMTLHFLGTCPDLALMPLCPDLAQIFRPDRRRSFVLRLFVTA